MTTSELPEKFDYQRAKTHQGHAFGEPQAPLPEQQVDDQAAKTSMGGLVISVVGAAFGVQSNKRRTRDFGKKSIVPFVIAGIVFTLMFIFGLLSIVSLVVG